MESTNDTLSPATAAWTRQRSNRKIIRPRDPAPAPPLSPHQHQQQPQQPLPQQPDVAMTLNIVSMNFAGTFRSAVAGRSVAVETAALGQALLRALVQHRSGTRRHHHHHHHLHLHHHRQHRHVITTDDDPTSTSISAQAYGSSGGGGVDLFFGQQYVSSRLVSSPDPDQFGIVGNPEAFVIYRLSDFEVVTAPTDVNDWQPQLLQRHLNVIRETSPGVAFVICLFRRRNANSAALSPSSLACTGTGSSGSHRLPVDLVAVSWSSLSTATTDDGRGQSAVGSRSQRRAFRAAIELVRHLAAAFRSPVIVVGSFHLTPEEANGILNALESSFKSSEFQDKARENFKAPTAVADANNNRASCVGSATPTGGLRSKPHDTSNAALPASGKCTGTGFDLRSVAADTASALSEHPVARTSVKPVDSRGHLQKDLLSVPGQRDECTVAGSTDAINCHGYRPDTVRRQLRSCQLILCFGTSQTLKVRRVRPLRCGRLCVDMTLTGVGGSSSRGRSVVRRSAPPAEDVEWREPEDYFYWDALSADVHLFSDAGNQLQSSIDDLTELLQLQKDHLFVETTYKKSTASIAAESAGNKRGKHWPITRVASPVRRSQSADTSSSSKFSQQRHSAAVSRSYSEPLTRPSRQRQLPNDQRQRRQPTPSVGQSNGAAVQLRHNAARAVSPSSSTNRRSPLHPVPSPTSKSTAASRSAADDLRRRRSASAENRDRLRDGRVSQAVPAQQTAIRRSSYCGVCSDGQPRTEVASNAGCSVHDAGTKETAVGRSTRSVVSTTARSRSSTPRRSGADVVRSGSGCEPPGNRIEVSRTKHVTNSQTHQSTATRHGCSESVRGRLSSPSRPPPVLDNTKLKQKNPPSTTAGSLDQAPQVRRGRSNLGAVLLLGTGHGQGQTPLPENTLAVATAAQSKEELEGGDVDCSTAMVDPEKTARNSDLDFKVPSTSGTETTLVQCDGSAKTDNPFSDVEPPLAVGNDDGCIQLGVGLNVGTMAPEVESAAADWSFDEEIFSALKRTGNSGGTDSNSEDDDDDDDDSGIDARRLAAAAAGPCRWSPSPVNVYRRHLSVISEVSETELSD